MKHVKPFLLFASFCLATLSSALADAVPFTYTTNSGAITITDYTGPGGAVVIPGTIDGYPVTAIGHDAFSECASLTEVVIPDSVTRIDICAFSGCTGLTEVLIGSGVTRIGVGAFCGCTGLTEVVIPDSVATIGDGAFFGCAGLTEVVIPESVTRIVRGAFTYCTSLTNIAVAAANPSYASVGGVLFDKTFTTLVMFPGGLTGPYAIPGSVTTFGEYAFYGCPGLTEVVFGSGVTTIGEGAFYDCTDLTNIAVAAANQSYASQGGVLFDKALTTLVQFPGGLVGPYSIPGSVTNIGKGAFYDCTGLTNVVIPDSVTNIGHEAFYGCTSLHKVYFHGNAPTDLGYVFTDGTVGTVYYLAGTTGWGSTFGGWPTALYQPAQP